MAQYNLRVDFIRMFGARRLVGRQSTMRYRAARARE